MNYLKTQIALIKCKKNYTFYKDVYSKIASLRETRDGNCETKKELQTKIMAKIVI